jgi:hypothetical protein
LADPIVQVAVTNAQTHAGVFPGDVMASLDVLNATHNAIEHDASLTRSDKYLGDWIRLNATLLQQLVPDASATLTKQDIAAARTKRIKDSQRRNPTFTWSVLNQKPVSAAESAFLTLILGDSDGNIPAKYLQFFLKYEQLPTSLGWTKNDISFSAFTGLSTWFLTQEFIAFGVEENEAAKMAQGSVRKYWSLKH